MGFSLGCVLQNARSSNSLVFHHEFFHDRSFPLRYGCDDSYASSSQRLPTIQPRRSRSLGGSARRDWL